VVAVAHRQHLVATGGRCRRAAAPPRWPRSRGGEEHLRVGDRCELGDLLGELDLRLDEVERRGVQDPAGLLLHRLDDLRQRVRRHRGEDPAEQVEVARCPRRPRRGGPRRGRARSARRSTAPSRTAAPHGGGEQLRVLTHRAPPGHHESNPIPNRSSAEPRPAPALRRSARAIARRVSCTPTQRSGSGGNGNGLAGGELAARAAARSGSSSLSVSTVRRTGSSPPRAPCSRAPTRPGRRARHRTSP
jgi:hypothetical protein